VLTGQEDTTYKELRYVRERFIRKDGLRQAIAKVVNATFAARQVSIWGEGSVESEEVEPQPFLRPLGQTARTVFP
jgi:TnpA family transposase